MRPWRWMPAVVLAAACSGEKPPADQSAPASPAAAAVNAPETARPTDSASSARAQPASASKNAMSPPASKANAGAAGGLRDSVIKPSVVIDEKTGAATPIKKKPR